MDTKEFEALGIKKCNAHEIAPGTTVLLMFKVEDIKQTIATGIITPIYVLDDPSVLAKDLEHGQVFRLKKGMGFKRCRVKHEDDDNTYVFAPAVEAAENIPVTVLADAPCTIVVKE